MMVDKDTKLFQHIKLNTQGTGCVLKFTLDAKGQVTAVKVESAGKNYTNNVSAVRNLNPCKMMRQLVVNGQYTMDKRQMD